MPTTNTDRLALVRTWQRWHVADEDARIAEARGDHVIAEQQRAARDHAPANPLRALQAARELIESLNAEQWDMITDARLDGATWDEIAHAVRKPTDDVRDEYTRLVNFMIENPPDEISPDLLDRYRAAR